MSLLRSNLAHGLGGLVLMGSWAAFANRAFPWPAPALAFAVQGALTAGITLLLKWAVELVVARQPTRPWLAPMAAAAISATLLTTVHMLAGTPALWATIAVPFFVATSYAALYTWRLVKDG
ncbi:MAG: hypothetical protein GY717_01410 [Rhodobacteraceae bacterium]|nr:hypothetical protein [Paracoccaceae bacterium]